MKRRNQLTSLASLPRSVALLLPKAFTLRLEVQLEEQILCSSTSFKSALKSGFVLPVARFFLQLKGIPEKFLSCRQNV
jgi:hypothetical protein